MKKMFDFDQWNLSQIQAQLIINIEIEHNEYK